MMPKVYKLIPDAAEPGKENVGEILCGTTFRLEHIRSFGDRSAAGFWYDQAMDEWVTLISGSASVEFEDGVLELVAGDSILIKAHQKHRVAQTSVDAVWIALHYVGISISSSVDK